jgi:hypothetical protein
VAIKKEDLVLGGFFEKDILLDLRSINQWDNFEENMWDFLYKKKTIRKWENH